MDADQYRQHGKELVDRIADYMENIRDQSVLPDKNLVPGFLQTQLPNEAPFNPEPYENIKKDMEDIILPSATHWQSPNMHAFFPALTSYPSMLGDMWADAINCLGFTWESSPICTELEIVAIDWLCKAIGLPDKFLHSDPRPGGGVILSTCSEATLTAMMAARKCTIDQQRSLPLNRTLSDADILSRLVGYTSNQAHSSVEKAGMLCMVKMRHLPVNSTTLALHGDTLRDAIKEDRAKGLIPFFICATLGTTGCCAFDDVESIGPVAQDAGLWLHVDAAYAGTAFLCPENRKFMHGMNFVNSFCFNPSKWMMVHFDLTAFWVENRAALENTFSIDPIYLSHKYSGSAVDFMIPLSRRFRALKLWYVMRCYGISGLQAHIRRGIELAAYFEKLVQSNKIFELKYKRHLGLVVFNLKDNNELTKILLREILRTRKIYVVPADLNGSKVIRFTVTSPQTTEDDIREAWELIESLGMKVLADDYEKCKSGECHSCNPTIKVTGSCNSPPSEISNEEEEGSHFEEANNDELTLDDDDGSERRTERTGTPCSMESEAVCGGALLTTSSPISGDTSDDIQLGITHAFSHLSAK